MTEFDPKLLYEALDEEGKRRYDQLLEQKKAAQNQRRKERYEEDVRIRTFFWNWAFQFLCCAVVVFVLSFIFYPEAYTHTSWISLGLSLFLYLVGAIMSTDF